MAIPADTCRAVLVGSAPGGEIFETGFWLKVNSALTLSQVNDLAAFLSDEFTGTARLPLAALIKTDTSYDTIKVYAYPSGGPTATWVGEAPVNTGHGSASSNSPLYMCMVASLKTGLAGRTHRGRMYLPASGLDLTDAHRLNAAKAAAACTGLANWFQAINGGPAPADAKVAVVSQKNTSWLEVSQVTIDDKPDVQRRRENKMDSGTTATAAV